MTEIDIKTKIILVPDRFATIDTPGSPPSLASTPKQKSTPLLSTSSPQNFPNRSPNPASEPIPSTSYPAPASAELCQDLISDPTLSSDGNPTPFASNPQSDQMVQNVFTTLMNNPSQLQRVLAALQSPIPMAMDTGPDKTHVSREAVTSPPLYNFRPPADGLLSPGSTLSLLSAASNAGNLSLPPGDDPVALNALAQSSNQLQKSYKDAAEVEADVNVLQGHIDSLIESLGLDSNMTAVLRGEQQRQQQQQHTDDEIVSSTEATGHAIPAPRLTDVNPDFVDFDAFLSQDFDAGTGLGGLGHVHVPFDPIVQQNGAERFGAFLDEVQSVSNESDKTAAESLLEKDRLSINNENTGAKGGKVPRKRKSDVAELNEEVKPTVKTPRTMKER